MTVAVSSKKYLHTFNIGILSSSATIHVDTRNMCNKFANIVHHYTIAHAIIGY